MHDLDVFLFRVGLPLCRIPLLIARSGTILNLQIGSLIENQGDDN